MEAFRKQKLNKPAETPALPGVFLLLKETLGIYWRNASLIFGYSAWLLVPMVISILARTTLDAESIEVIDLFFNLVLYTVLSVFLTVLFIKATPFLRKKKRLPKELPMHAIILAVPYLLSALLVPLIVLGGLVLLIIPGILFLTWFAFAPIMVVLEQERILPAFAFSKELVQGRFGAVLWRLFGGFFWIWLAYLSVLVGILYASFYAHGGGDLEVFLTTPLRLSEDTLLRIADIIFLPIAPIYMTLLYLSLKKR